MSRLQGREISIAETIQIQSAVIGGLILREIYSRFGRDNIGFLWLIVEPALFTTGVIVLWSLAFESKNHNTPIVPFLLTGYMPLIIYRHVVAVCLRCMQNNQQLLYHRRVTVLSIYLSKQLVEILGVLTSFTFCMIYFGILGFVEVPKFFGMMVGGWGIYIWYCASLALVVGALSERFEIVEKFWAPISYVTIPTTGAFFLVSWLPADARELLLYFPMVTGSEMIRGGYFGHDIKPYYDVTYACTVCFIQTIVGLFLLKDVRIHVEVV